MGWWLLNQFWGDAGPPPEDSGSLKLTLYDPTLLGLQFTLGEVQAQFWADSLQLRLYGTAKVGLRLVAMDASSSNPPTPDTFVLAVPSRIATGLKRSRTAVAKPRSP